MAGLPVSGTPSMCCGRRFRPAPCPVRPKFGQWRSLPSSSRSGVASNAGAVGYLNWFGEADLAIAIRTALVSHGTVHVQAGAGIVA